MNESVGRIRGRARRATVRQSDYGSLSSGLCTPSLLLTATWV